MKKNLAIIITKLEGGGAERVASNLSLSLSDEYNVYLLVFDCKEIKYPYMGELVDVGIPASNNSVSRIINVMRRIYRVRRIKRDYNISVSISLLDTPNIVNILSSGKDKVIISVRNKLSFFIKRPLDKLRIRVLYNKADSIVALSNLVKKDLSENFKVKNNKIKSIYNSCDVDRITELSEEKVEKKLEELFNTNDVLVTVGRLEDQKAQWHMIRSFKRVKENRPNVKLLIIGKGSLEAYLRNLTKELSLEEDVLFLGYVENPFKYVSKAKIFVFSSVVEGLGNVLLEAMACGLPVISTDCQAGPREIIAPNTPLESKANSAEFHKYGVLVPVCDGIKYNLSELTREEVVLSDAILDMLKDKEKLKLYRESSLKRVRDFNPDRIDEEWKNLINV